MSKIDYNKYKVSIIIPVYNAEKYLEECFASILQLKHKNLEVILVDDESTDKSPQIIERQCSLDKRFINVRISNHDPAYARNIGLDKATGDYILFLDNDGLLAPNAISKLCRKVVKNRVEVVAGMSKRINNLNLIFKVALIHHRPITNGSHFRRKHRFHLEQLAPISFIRAEIAFLFDLSQGFSTVLSNLNSKI